MSNKGLRNALMLRVVWWRLLSMVALLWWEPYCGDSFGHWQDWAVTTEYSLLLSSLTKALRPITQPWCLGGDTLSGFCNIDSHSRNHAFEARNMRRIWCSLLSFSIIVVRTIVPPTDILYGINFWISKGWGPSIYSLICAGSCSHAASWSLVIEWAFDLTLWLKLTCVFPGT